MRFGWRDRLASLFVFSGTALYAAWSAGVGSTDDFEVRLLTTIVLLLGVAASASAVVPGFIGLLHGSKAYLVVTSAIGLGALVAGIAALVSAREEWLAMLVMAMVVLWAISTAHHAVLAEQRGPRAATR
jgi:hypothetical protein